MNKLIKQQQKIIEEFDFLELEEQKTVLKKLEKLYNERNKEDQQYDENNAVIANYICKLFNNTDIVKIESIYYITSQNPELDDPSIVIENNTEANNSGAFLLNEKKLIKN